MAERKDPGKEGYLDAYNLVMDVFKLKLDDTVIYILF